MAETLTFGMTLRIDKLLVGDQCILIKYKKHISFTILFVILNLVIFLIENYSRSETLLESLGIVLATLLLGWKFGVACGLLTIVLRSYSVDLYLDFHFLWFPVAEAFILVGTTHLLRKFNLFSSYARVLFSGVAMALVSVPSSATFFIVYEILYDGHTFLSYVKDFLLFSLRGLPLAAIDQTLVVIIALTTLRAVPKAFIDRHQFQHYKDS